jgi:AraC-like DNA-binding protein
LIALPTGAANCGHLILAVLEEQRGFGSKEHDLPILKQEPGRMKGKTGGSTMSYDPKLLFEQISVCLNENPRKTLEELAQSLHVSQRTIKKTVRLLTGGNFRHYREEVLLERVKGFFAMQPGAAIKVLSIDLGFKSPSSFARAVRRASGACPGELRTCVAGESPAAEEHATFY